MSNQLDWLMEDEPTGGGDGAMPPPVAVHRDSSRKSPNWIVIGLCAVIAVMLVIMFRGGCDGGGILPDERISIDERGTYALILEDGSEEGQSKLSKGQKEAITSIDVADWCENNDVQFRRFDKSLDLPKTENAWQKMKAVAASAPSLTVLSDGKAVTGPVPNSVQETIAKIEENK